MYFESLELGECSQLATFESGTPPAPSQSYAVEMSTDEDIFRRDDAFRFSHHLLL